MLLFLQQQKRVCVGGIYLYFLIQKKSGKIHEKLVIAAIHFCMYGEGAKLGKKQGINFIDYFHNFDF